MQAHMRQETSSQREAAGSSRRRAGAAAGAAVLICALLCGCGDQPVPEATLFADLDPVLARSLFVEGNEETAGYPLDAESISPQPPAKESCLLWRWYEDDQVRFAYPDDPDIRVVVTDEEGVLIVPDAVRTAANTFSRLYTISLRGKAICAVMLESNDDFDNSTCFCGAIVLEKYLFRHGALFRLSLMDTGEVKKVQALSNGQRAEFLEWTHLPIPQRLYLKIALSVSFRNGPVSPAAMTAAVVKRYGFLGKLGFLERGMTAEQVRELLGPPAQQTSDAMVYSRNGGWFREEYETTYELSMSGGVFIGLERGWETSRELPVKRGSARWICRTLEPRTWREQGSIFGDEEEEASSRPAVTPELAKYMFDGFARMVAERELEWSDSWDLVHAMSILQEQGYTDVRVLAYLRRHLFEPGQPDTATSPLLAAYEPVASRPWFARRTRELLAEAAKKGPEPFRGSARVVNPFRYLGRETDEYLQLVHEGLRSPDAYVRADAYSEWPHLPDGLAVLGAGLRDPDAEVRSACVDTIEGQMLRPEWVPLLREARRRETDEFLIEQLDALLSPPTAVTRPAE